MPNCIFLIDGTAFAYRAFFAIRGLTNSKGRPTNAVYGFARVLIKIMREHKPSHIAVVFDAPGKTFRDDLYPEYKATRDATPEDLVSQFPLIEELVRAFNIPTFRVRGVEADDVIGTLARRAEAQGMETVIVTGDKDALQLVTDRVRVFDPNKGDNGAWYGPNEVKERFGVEPQHVIDSLALMGDTADNVPGVRGIGEKTARTLLEKYGSLDGVYAHLDELKGKQKERLTEDKETAYLSRTLVTINSDVPLDRGVEDCQKREFDREHLAEVFASLEFKALLEEFLPKGESTETTDYRLVLTEAELAAVIAEMRASGCFAVDTETTSTDPMRATLVGVSMSCRPTTGYYIPVGHAPETFIPAGQEDELFPDQLAHSLTRERALTMLRPLLEDPSLGKIGHNIKYDLIVLERAGIRLAGIVLDTMVTSYLTDPSRFRHNLEEASLQYLRRKMIPISDLIGSGSKAITFDKVPVQRACEYASEDADITWRLAGVFQPLLRERALEALFGEVELPLISVLARMEMTGVVIDLEVFEGLRKEIGTRLRALEEEIFVAAGGPFSINSPKQLQEILFTKLGLKPTRKTKTGYSTDVDVLEELSRDHPLPEKILEYRTLEKLRGTYVDALPKLVHPETGRIHTSFNQAVAATGRLSSSDPNLQNIPVRTEIGRRIRQGFVPGGKGLKLISADYSQIELRILAHLSGDTQLKLAFQQDEDVHRQTAARVFGVALSDVTSDMRRQAKAVNFGVVYGISPFGLAKNLGIPTAAAAQFIDQYFAQYPAVKQWITDTLERAVSDGYVTTLLNRRRYVPELNSSEVNTRKAAERAAINTPVQGSAADIIKLAMVRLDNALAGTSGRMLLQVHDELLLEAREDEAEAIAALTKKTMEEAVTLDVHLRVDVGIGNNWDEIH
ncbi:MAG: DNA polymerase I [Candidatus Hydrogenedentes bacterium]|nr:DNA polymerase I [Candidatus Hydrogenedentota bacterium]